MGEFNQDQWMYMTMADVMGVPKDEEGDFRSKFSWLYRRATDEQRLFFWRETKLGQEFGEEGLADAVLRHEHRWAEVVPARSSSRGKDIAKYVVPVEE